MIRSSCATAWLVLMLMAFGSSPLQAQSTTGENSGDPISLLFRAAQRLASDHAQSFDQRFIDYEAVSHEMILSRRDYDRALAWLELHATDLAVDIQRAEHQWLKDDEADQDSCATTGSDRDGPVFFKRSVCLASVAGIREAVRLLIHESVHHFSHVSPDAPITESFCDVVAVIVELAGSALPRSRLQIKELVYGREAGGSEPLAVQGWQIACDRWRYQISAWQRTGVRVDNECGMMRLVEHVLGLPPDAAPYRGALFVSHGQMTVSIAPSRAARRTGAMVTGEPAASHELALRGWSLACSRVISGWRDQHRARLVLATCGLPMRISDQDPDRTRVRYGSIPEMWLVVD